VLLRLNNLDLTFHYFGASTNPTLFFFNGIIGSIVSGVGIGVLLFSTAGNAALVRLSFLIKRN